MSERKAVLVTDNIVTHVAVVSHNEDERNEWFEYERNRGNDWILLPVYDNLAEEPCIDWIYNDGVFEAPEGWGDSPED